MTDSDRIDWRIQGAVYACGALNHSMGMMVAVIMPLWLLKLDASAFIIGIALGARHFLPLFLSIHGGALMDRFGTRRIMLWFALISAAVPILFPVMPWIWAVIALQMIVGLADTMGRATPEMVSEVVSAVRDVVDCEIEFHGHNDGGCAVANAWAAWRAGATHIDTTVLGIGERNGIAPLAGLIARLVLHDPDLCADLALTRLVDLDRLVADRLGIEIPHDACISAPEAFTHTAGLHTAAVLVEPRCYESLDPAMFGRSRRIPLGHRLIGRHALAARAAGLGLCLSPAVVASVTAEVKRRADDGPLELDAVDALLRAAAEPVVPEVSSPARRDVAVAASLESRS